MTSRTCLSIILAAGEGTRMNSTTPKALHKVAGLPMVAHVMRAAESAGSGATALVVGHAADVVVKALTKLAPGAETFVQAERLGTAHAVLAARAALERGADDVLILFGDTPLVQSADLDRARAELAAGSDIVVMGFRTDNPDGYGRLIQADGRLIAIREHRDCSEAERAIRFCNGGLMAVSGSHALSLLDAVGNTNAKGEYYLTDIVAIGHERGLKVAACEVSAESVLGVNTLVELAEVEAIWQRRRRREVMLAGTVLQDPASVYFAYDTVLACDVIIEPGVYFGPGVTVETGAVIHAFSHIEGARVGPGAEVGPYARLRPGADLAEKAKVGNFCEVKKATVEKGAKVNHLTYIGDARVGAGANIGAGTITCNYDGFRKFHTDIGAGAFVGSNSSLVAPVAIGDGGYVASGSVITEDVPADALAFGRARQKTMPDKARQLRERLASQLEG